MYMDVTVESAPNIHRQPVLCFTEGGWRGFGESIQKRKVFSEALAMAFPTAILQMRSCTYSIINESIGWVSCSIYRFTGFTHHKKTTGL